MVEQTPLHRIERFIKQKMSKQTVKEKIIEALENYEGSDFVVNSQLIHFIKNVGGRQMTTAEKARGLSTEVRALVVVLSSCGNPDFGQYAPLSQDELTAVANLQVASDVCMEYIRRWDLGCGNWDGGQVYHPTNGVIAHVSYNGKVWPGDWSKWDVTTPAITGEVLKFDYTKL